MKLKERTAIANMKVVELVKLIAEEKHKLADYRVNRYSKQSKNVRETTAIRRKVAIAQTVLRSKELLHE
jgi:ribosomal protein L29